MSASLLIFGLIIAIFTGIFCGTMADSGLLRDNRYCTKTICIGFFGTLLSLFIIGLSFCYVCPAHLMASLKYDHVIVVNYSIKNGSNVKIDQDKVVWRNEYCGNGGVEYATVIMAWDDKNPNAKYDEITAKESANDYSSN